MGFLPLAISGLTGLAGGLANTSRTDTSGPTGSSLALLNQLSGYYGNQMQNTTPYVNSVEQSGLNAIKSNTDNLATGAMNANAANGVRGTAAAYASMVPRVAGSNQVASLETQLPQIRNQYQNQVEGNALGAIQAGPHSTTFAGNPLGGAFSSLATSLAGLFGKKTFGSGGNGGGYDGGLGGGGGYGDPSNGGFDNGISGGGND